MVNKIMLPSVPFLFALQSAKVGSDELLGLAAKCLAQPGAAATGSGIIEGILGLTPAAYFAACLAVLLRAPDSGARDALLSMLSRIPIGMLPVPVIAEALSLLTSALQTGALAPPSLPLQLFDVIFRSEAVLLSLTASIVDPNTSGRQVKSELREKAWTLEGPENAAADDFGGASGDSAGGASSAAGPAPIIETPASFVPAHLVALGPSHRPLWELWNQSLSSVLESLLNAVSFGNIDASVLCDQLQQLLGTMFEVVGQQGDWALEWIWKLYQVRSFPSSFDMRFRPTFTLRTLSI